MGVLVKNYYDAFYFKIKFKFFVYFSPILLKLNLFVFAWILEKNNDKFSNHVETQGALNGVSYVKIGHMGAEEHLRK